MYMKTKLEDVEANLAMARYNLQAAERVINDPRTSDKERSRARSDAEEHRRDITRYERQKMELEQKGVQFP